MRMFIRGLTGFFGSCFSRLIGLKRPSAGIRASQAENCPLDPAEFARLVRSGKRQDFEKLAQMLLSRPLSPGEPAESGYSRKSHRAGDKHGIGRH